MAIKKDSIIAIAKLLRIDTAKVEAALAATDEVELALPTDLTILSATELESRENVLKTAAQKAGREYAVKELKEAAGLDYEGEGSKDPKRFVTEYGKKVLKDANVQESEKVAAANQTIEQLRVNITTLTTEKDGILKQTREAQQDNELLTMTIDKKPDNLTNKEWLAIVKLNNEITEENGVQVVKRDGKIVANPTDLKPIPVKDALHGWIDERKLGKTVAEPPKPGGRGEGDSRTHLLGIGNMKQFNEHLTSQNINPNGQQAQAMLNEITSANANFDFSTK
jgi:hypothetical protein